MDAPTPGELIAGLRESLRDLWSEQRGQATIDILQRQASFLAASVDHRIAQGAAAELWHPLSSLWIAVADLISADEERFIPLATALAIFLRNLVAGVPENQSRVYGLCHLRLDRLLVLCSALVKLQRPHFRELTRACAQLLVNLVTDNTSLRIAVWTFYQCGDRADTLTRLLGTSDPRTLLAVCVFVLNCVAGLPSQLPLMLRPGAPSRLAAALLMTLESQLEETEGETAETQVLTNVFDPVLKDPALFDLAYDCQASTDTIPSRPQVILLNFLDEDLRHRPHRDPPSAKTAASARARFVQLSASQQRHGPAPLAQMALALAASCCSEIYTRLKSAKLPHDPPPVASLLALLASEVEAPAQSVSPAAARLRRELVRLIGVVAWQSPADQDVVRQRDGLPLLLSLTRIDDRNPLLREHTNFSLAALLKDNVANQQAVIELQQRAVSAMSLS